MKKKKIESVRFGELLRMIRVDEAKIGLRKFANLINFQSSNFSDIERGIKPPPANKPQIDLICDTLGLSNVDPRRVQLFDLAAKDQDRVPADISETIKSNSGVPVLVRTIANKQLSEKKIRELSEYIENNY